MMAKAMTEVKDSVVDLERHRLQLEENVFKLRKSLQHWQTWEADYKGMKEEIGSLDDQYSVTELKHAAAESVGILLDEKEVNLILHDDKARLRGNSQIIGLLSRRIDYVQQNVKAVASYLSTAEEKLATSSVTRRPDVHNEEGLSLTEIWEELDEEGNIISSSTSAPGNAAPQVVKVLRKAGVGRLSDTPELVSQSDVDMIDREDELWVTEYKPDTPATSILKSPKLQVSDGPSFSRDSYSEGTEPRSSSRMKSVTFAKGTKLTDASSSKSKQVTSRRALKTISEIKRQAGLTKVPDELLKPNKPSKSNLEKITGAKVDDTGGGAISSQLVPETTDDAIRDLTEDHKAETTTTLSRSESSIGINPCYPSNKPTSREENNPSNRRPDSEVGNRDTDTKSPIIPVDESPEDAALRRLMLKYSMNEVGSVVAEIELDEEDVSPSDASSTDDEGGSNSDASNTEEDEDEYGRTKRPVLDDAYFEEMRALEKKLNATAIQNVGPHGREVASPGNDSSEDPTNLPSKSSIFKRVRFTEQLDVQNAPSKDSKSSITECISIPIKHNIIERVASMPGFIEPTAAPKKKISRFKSARTGGSTISPPNIESDMPVADSIADSSFLQKNTLPPLNSSRYHLPNHTAFTDPHGTRQVPTGPVNRTYAANVLERPYSPTANSSTAVGPDELDSALLYQQVATEYHHMRNRMIHRQGGFLATDEEKAEIPLTEEEGGAPKISRFKAARLAQLR